MMNTKKSKIALLLSASALSMALIGCGDGKDGTPGNPGTPGGEPAKAIKQVNIQFDKVAIKDGIPSVDFIATNEENLPIVGMQYFTFYSEQLLPEGLDAKLNPQPGESSVWQYLINETCNIKANDCKGTLVDHKNGHYSYTFAANLNTSTLATYDSQLAHRIVINNRIRNSDPIPLPDNTTLPIFTGIYDFMPNTGGAAEYTRKIVTTASCNACHEDVINAKHYTSDVNFCASCHTSGKVKAGNEFNVLIHAKHKDVKLNALDTCQSCHVESEDAPDWSNWSRIPTAATCGSCHTDVDFAAGKGHPQQLDNSNCIACHSSEWTTEIHTNKTADKKAVIALLGMEATLVANADNTAVLTVAILDKDGKVVDAESITSKIKHLEAITNVGPNAPVMGYHTQFVNDLVKDGSLSGATIVDKKFVLTLPALPFNAGDTDTAFSFVGLEVCNTGTTLTPCATNSTTTSMKAELAFGTQSGKAPSMRHVNSVEFGTCQGCHGETFEIHKKYHAGFVMTEQLSHTQDANGKPIVGVDGCVTCHTPQGAGYSSNGMAIEIRAHKTHAPEIVNGKVSEGIIKECSQCHNDFNLDAFKVKGAMEFTKGKYTTPITATCTSCHTIGTVMMDKHTVDFLTRQGGAIIDGTYDEANAAAQSETCFYCHKPTPTDHTQVKM